ncbi:MAG: DinB family protein [Acidobacteria bacterium]|jgi:uncharacterized damage-inducible protein DinB|nr:DinB family protein [Acidobacteriota bacterium]
MKVEREVLEPTAGVSREIGFYLSSLEEVRAELRQAVEDLSDEENLRKILPNVQPIGALILHIGEAEFWWIQSIVMGREMDEEMNRIAHSDNWEEDNFAEKGYGVKYCIEAIDKISRMTIETLADFTAEDLEKIHVLNKPDKRIELSLRSILHHLVQHQATHKGQILMLKRFLHESQN